ncbi:MAG: VanZ family protein [Vicinamibacterales bacterium]
MSPAVARRLWLWLPVAAYMAVIFWLSAQSHPPAPPGLSDKWQHGLAYAGLALVSLRALAGGRWSGVTLAALAGAWLIATAYGATDECHQMFTPARTPDLMDLAADATGALAGAAAAGAWSIIRRL